MMMEKDAKRIITPEQHSTAILGEGCGFKVSTSGTYIFIVGLNVLPDVVDVDFDGDVVFGSVFVVPNAFLLVVVVGEFLYLLNVVGVVCSKLSPFVELEIGTVVSLKNPLSSIKD